LLDKRLFERLSERESMPDVPTIDAARENTADLQLYSGNREDEKWARRWRVGIVTKVRLFCLPLQSNRSGCHFVRLLCVELRSKSVTFQASTSTCCHLGAQCIQHSHECKAINHIPYTRPKKGDIPISTWLARQLFWVN